MKKETRTQITCIKMLPNFVLERFATMVRPSDVQQIKKDYESRGYKVTVG